MFPEGGTGLVVALAWLGCKTTLEGGANPGGTIELLVLSSAGMVLRLLLEPELDREGLVEIQAKSDIF